MRRPAWSAAFAAVSGVTARLAASRLAISTAAPTCAHVSRVNHVNHLHVKCTRRGTQPPRELAVHVSTESRRVAVACLVAHGLRLCTMELGAGGAPMGPRRWKLA